MYEGMIVIMAPNILLMEDRTAKACTSIVLVRFLMWYHVNATGLDDFSNLFFLSMQIAGASHSQR